MKRVNISPVKPEALRPPENMSAACVAKCHAANQVDLITHEINRLIKLRKAWKKRHQQCLDVMHRIAIHGA